MNVAVIGTGYVGLNTAVSLALHGHRVVGIDVDEEKVKQLKQRHCPIYEPGLEEAMRSVMDQGNLHFDHTLNGEAKEADILFICVGTPESADGSADLGYLFAVVEDVRAVYASNPVRRGVVIKSTVPVGTGDRVAELLGDCKELHVISNPEFLREGSALQDALNPSRIVIGAESAAAFSLMDELYEGYSCPMVKTTRRTAELIKYASNAFLATRISFMNELARLSTVLGTDIETVARGMGLDSRIGPEFLRAGIGYGGSCFPKDTIALLQVGKRNGVKLSILEQVREVNRTQPEWCVQLIREQLGGLHGKRVAVLGLSFKPDTDDIRESRSLPIIKQLLHEGAIVSAYDPISMETVAKLYPQVSYADDIYATLTGADAALLATEWKQCVNLDWQKAKAVMAKPVLFDGRNAWPSELVKQYGFAYQGVGRS
ncbi:MULTISPECIES: UDP-glucose dehydrogenase family protein [Brevibacillus]|jgi:UDPglucose 6-dehydrogenase|uniref:UDP-glucose 6-dehydrogenase n=1 Tax=Brevibacillus borstelensis AK1 TaxID=1300222 RepID=M8E2M6_9BACL|nr:UDP-glucose/GDP-mannose dehydrogenase family protein [Brevibacillus borstelensis]EMT53536.1 UDP-glucose 6-dehydrogenase [Brevibacillus borstelensis AK1]KKX53081.1 UDP-glucose 6-dehydrogenase [Brevibacillus borstelensis cifa_chp40]MBE5397856.1 UDP-glucose/GDP-mannose dehydrogenase family protein [Brevibacillus borstelensis]